MELYIMAKPPKDVTYEQIAEQLRLDYLAETKKPNRKVNELETASLIYNLQVSDKFNLSDLQKGEVARILIRNLWIVD